MQTFTSALATGTGPAVSTGGPIMSVQFADRGWVENVDHLIDSWKKSGLYDDFLPGTFEPFKSKDGYQAVPFAVGIEVVWYRKSLLDKAGVGVPTDWPSWLEAAKALKKIGVYGYGTATGAGNNIGQQGLLSLMINNGGGLFAADGSPNCVTDRNIEAMDFVAELLAAGAIDPGAVSYTSSNLNDQWKSKQIGLGWYSPGLAISLGEQGSDDLLVASPLVGPHGDKGSISYPNNLIIYKNNPSLEACEEVVTNFVQNMHVFWEQGLFTGVPILKSIANSDAVKQKSPEFTKIVTEWQPVTKTLKQVALLDSAKIEKVDASVPLISFAQTVLQGGTDAKTALTTLQAGLEQLMA
jgi:multiple sugar transport system substrate-binding protein